MYCLEYADLVMQFGPPIAYSLTLTGLEFRDGVEGLAAYIHSGTRQIAIMTSDQASNPSLNGHWSPVTEAPYYLGFPPA